MKTHIIIIILLLSSLTVFAQKKEKVKGNREVTTVIYELDPFTALEIKEELDVILINGTTSQVEVNTDENLHEFMDINVIDGTLKISTTKDIRSFKKMEIFITVSEDLQLIHAESDAEIKSLTTLHIKKAEINALGNAELDLKLKSDSIAVNNYGKTNSRYEIDAEQAIVTAFENADVKAKINTKKLTSHIEFATAKLEGQTDTLFLKVKEKGEWLAPLFKAKDVSVTATEQAKIIVNSTEKITIDATNRSEIELLGSPKSIIMIRFEDEAVLRKVDENKRGLLKRIF